MPRASSLAAAIYAAAIYGFIFLPVVVLAVFSLQGSQIPVPPFNGPSLKWYALVLSDPEVVAALGHSALVATVSSAISVMFGFSPPMASPVSRLPGPVCSKGFSSHPCR